MTIREMQCALGQRMYLRMESLQIPVIIEDVKEAWGRPRFLVRPIGGTGEQWVEIQRLVKPVEPQHTNRSNETCLTA